MKGVNMKQYGGSCIMPGVKNRRRDTDYDGYNDYQDWTLEKDY